MKIAFCSLKEFQKLTPSKDIVVVSLHDDPSLNKEDWKVFKSINCQALEPVKGSFHEIDEQAMRIAMEIGDIVKTAELVIFQCQYGEIRSKTLAQGVAYSELGGFNEIYEIRDKQWIETPVEDSGIFESRTASIISDAIDEMTKKVNTMTNTTKVKPQVSALLDYLKQFTIGKITSTPFVIFHHDDMDGAVAAASVVHGFKNGVISVDDNFEIFKSISESIIKNMTFVNINYDRQDDKTVMQFVPEGAVVFVLDFAFNREVTDRLIEKAGFFLTLDHHKRNEEILGNSENTYFDMESSGALMAFEYFCPGDTWGSLAVTLADNRDLWKKTHGGEDAFHEAAMLMRSNCNGDNKKFILQLAELLNEDKMVSELLSVGESMILKRDSNIKSATAKKRLIHTTMGGYPTVLFNYGVDQSDACEFLYLQDEYKDHIVGAFSFLANGMVNFSLRKGKDCKADLSDIAHINYGGGGHAVAAGFHIPYARAVKILEGKEKWAMCFYTDEVYEVKDNAKDPQSEILKLKPLMVSRDVCETAPEFLQVLPYVAIVDKDTNEILTYRRPASGGESRLHGNLSVGFGGHVDLLPTGTDMKIHLADEAFRELNEEIGLVDNGYVRKLYDSLRKGDFTAVHDTSDEVGRVHMGLFLKLEVDKKDLTKVQENEISALTWMEDSKIRTLINTPEEPVENWTRIFMNMAFEMAE